MLPVSGAEQLKTSGAQLLRPMISHSGAYSRLLSDPPWSLGCQRFQRPAARAFGLSSSTMRVGIQALPLARLSAISSKNRASRGLTCSCMKADSFFWRALTLSENSKFMAVSSRFLSWGAVQLGRRSMLEGLDRITQEIRQRRGLACDRVGVDTDHLAADQQLVGTMDLGPEIEAGAPETF